MSDALQQVKSDDPLDASEQTPIDIDDNDDDGTDSERKDAPPAFETLAQVEPKPLQSWLIRVTQARRTFVHGAPS